MPKVVLDTNVLISGVIASGHSASILNAARHNKITLISSAHLLAEFSEAVTRRHIARKYPEATAHAEALLDFLRAFSVLTSGVLPPMRISTDRDDDYVLACAEEGEADAIVSGDPHLLNLKSYRDIPIMSPRDFVKQFLQV